MEKKLDLLIQIRLENENTTVNVPLHIRDISIKSKLANEPVVEIDAVIQDREEFKKWGEFLANLPLGSK